MYWVNYWGSKPESNDDCSQGFDFEQLYEAQAMYEGPHPKSVAWIQLVGPGNVYQERENPDYCPVKDTDDDWRREMQREDAMLHGIEGWNAWEGM